MTRTLTKTLRLIEMVEMMKRRPRGVGELAAHFGTTRRTIERDLDDLRDTEYASRAADHRYAIPTRTGALNQVEELAVHSAARVRWRSTSSRSTAATSTPTCWPSTATARSCG